MISELMKKFVGDKGCIHFQYEPLSETSLRWLNKGKTKYKPARATILLPEALCPNEDLLSLHNHCILLIAIPKDKMKGLI